EDDLRHKRDWHAATERKRADLALFSEPARVAEIARAGEAHLSWVDMQRAELERRRQHILTQDLDALIGDETWAAMKAEMIAAGTEYWMLEESYGAIELRKVRTTLFDYSEHGRKFALREDLLDLYSRSAAAQASIPPALRDELEPKLRHITRA